MFLEGWREKEQLQLACLPNQSELVPRECLLELEEWERKSKGRELRRGRTVNSSRNEVGDGLQQVF